MSKSAWIPSIIITIGCLFCTVLAQQPTPPAKIPNVVEEPTRQPQLPPVVQNAVHGRYHAVALGQGGMFLLVDTHTGQCWSKYEHMPQWRDQGSPQKVKE